MWIGKWLRRKRGLKCPDLTEGNLAGITVGFDNCKGLVRSLRTAKCQGGGGLLDTLHNSLNCLSFNTASAEGGGVVLSLIISLAVTWGR